MIYLFNLCIYHPILNLTVFLYGTVGLHDLGIAILGVTVLVRAALTPLSLKMTRSQKVMAELTSQIEQIKQKHTGNTQAQSEAVMQLYKEKGVNPFGGCLLQLIQLPILIGVYRVFLNIFKPESLQSLYSFIPNPEAINHFMFGFLDISVSNPFLAIGAGVVQFIQMKFMTAIQPQTPQTAGMNKQMTYILPAMIIVFGWNLPAGLALYWIATSVWSIGELLYLRRK